MASSSSSSCIYSNPPCAACKFLRRKCLPGCTFAPYFPPEEPTKFASVHKVFGASNVSKLLNEIPPHQREDAVNSLAYEADARLRDPVYGCVGAISVLQRQVAQLQKELDATNAELMRYTRSDKKAFTGDVVLHGDDDEGDEDDHRQKIRINNGLEYGGGGSFDPSLGVFGISYSWNND